MRYRNRAIDALTRGKGSYKEKKILEVISKSSNKTVQRPNRCSRSEGAD